MMTGRNRYTIINCIIIRLMKSFKFFIIIILHFLACSSAYSKTPIDLIKIVNEASIILSSSDPVDSKLLSLMISLKEV